MSTVISYLEETKDKMKGEKLTRGSSTGEMTFEQRLERLETTSYMNFQANTFEGEVIANSKTLSYDILLAYSRGFK